MGIMLALGLGCKVNMVVPYNRKNYFYPDLPKGYQITQFYTPLGEDGSLKIFTKDYEKDVLIERIHLEEDSGKMSHDGDITSSCSSLVDYNRCGAPLAEIVTKPCLETPEEAWLYLVAFRNLVRYLGVSSGNMDEGALRCDLNISVKNPDGTLGTKVEIKNLNSFRSARRALEFEATRQRELIASGGKVVPETRHFNESTGETSAMRSKEELNDYRYFPEPDLPPLEISDILLGEVKRLMPETPNIMRERFVTNFGLSLYDASVLTAEKETASFFEEATKTGIDPKKISNWLTVEIAGKLSKSGKTLTETKITPQTLAQLVGMVEGGKITNQSAKLILDDVMDGASPEAVASEKRLIAVNDTDAIRQWVVAAIEGSPSQKEQYKSGKTQLLGFFVGQVMKLSKGKAPANIVQEILKEELER